MEILGVLGIIALIAVAGLVIYLLAGLIISIIDKKNVKLFNTEEAKPNQEKEQQLLLQDSSYELNLDEEEAKEEGNAIDLDAADREKAEIDAQKAALAEREEEVKAEPLDEESEESEENEEESLDEMYQRLIADINAEASQEEEQPEEAEETAEEEPAKEEQVEEAVEEVEEVEEEQPEQQPEEAAEEPVEEVAEEAAQDAEKDEMQKEIDALKAQLQAEQAEKDELARKLEEKPEAEVVETESLESLQARLEVLNERLAASEKELKANKKEYLPLARIQKHLEADKTKLRRKEAVVAKQKVMLFGVNNYVVDPEKEQKLSEDLDVLDALRLSVQHCEEVMKDNADRYPILENTNKILTKQVADLKADVADLEARIAKLNGEGEGEGAADASDAE